VGIAFLYCDYRDQENQSTLSMVSSLLKQLISSKPALPLPVVDLYERFEKSQSTFKLKDLEPTLLLVCREFRRTFVMIDALDECDATRHRKSFLQVLKSIEKSSTRLLITSRPYPDDIKRYLVAYPQITIEANDLDIRKFLTETIDRSDETTDIIDQALKKDIVKDIANSAHGMLV
jgi:hypothetical protein